MATTAFIDRLRLIAWPARFVPNPVPGTNERPADDTFIDALMHQHLSEFFSWAVAGAIAWYRNRRLELPPAAREQQLAYVGDQNPVAAFVREKCVLGAGQTAPAGELYRTYRDWVEAEKPLSNPAFKKRVLQLDGVTDGRVAAHNLYRGIGIRPPTEPITIAANAAPAAACAVPISSHATRDVPSAAHPPIRPSLQMHRASDP